MDMMGVIFLLILAVGGIVLGRVVADAMRRPTAEEFFASVGAHRVAYDGGFYAWELTVDEYWCVRACAPDAEDPRNPEDPSSVAWFVGVYGPDEDLVASFEDLTWREAKNKILAYANVAFVRKPLEER